MHFLQKLPSFALRHKFVSFLHKTRLVTNPTLASFNGGAKAYLDLSDPEPRNVFIKQVFEPDFFTIAKAMLPPDGYFFDLGANLGLCSFGLMPDRPKTFFHLFEANARLAALLKKSCTLYPDSCFILSNFCVTDEPGQTIFHIEEKQSGQSHVATDSGSGKAVPNLLLDHYCKQRKVDFVDLAKIDLEGHELPALLGWRKFLSEHRANGIYIEIIPENQARYGRPPNAPLLYLESLGYELYLCKEEDFGLFGNSPIEISLRQGSLTLSHFRAEEYPEDFATDALALAPT